jgi:alanine racemase
LRPRRAAPADAVRPTRAEVNLHALRHNLHVAKKHAGSAAVWAVMKADGYGHGAPAVARTLERSGADGFCVALLEEAIELREAGIRVPILVMGGYYGGAHAELVQRGLIPVVYDLSQVESFAKLVSSDQVRGPVNVHLKIDTGMARLGVPLRDVAKIAERLAHIPEVTVTGLMTHLASADALGPEETREQVRRFEEATAILARHGICPNVRHAANSAALLRDEARFDLVRPGIALFGASPTDPTGAPFTRELRSVMRVRSEVVDIRDVQVGDTVGYGGNWTATRPTRIATVPCGYADGLSRQLSNRGHLLVRGKRAPLVGAISMDMSMIDVTDLPGVSIRDEVVVLGQQDGPLGDDAITAEEIAEHIGSIPWEVLTSISRRVPRFYREP